LALGRIKVDDVSGSWLGNLRAGTITIADDDGVWLEAHDVALDWSPQDVLFGTVRLHVARANSIAIARRQHCSTPRQPAEPSISRSIRSTSNA
jgi:translocation and assembly module TamB